MIIGCRKAVKETDESVDNKYLFSTAFNEWIDSQKEYSTTDEKRNIDSVITRLDWKRASIRAISENQKFVYVPINTPKKNKGFLFLINSKKGSILFGYLTEYFEKDINYYNAALNVIGYFNNSSNVQDGSISLYRMNNKFIFEVGFSKGNAIYKKMIQPNVSISSGNIKSNGCVSYYLNTFWSDGSVTREFLFTTCSSDPSPCEQTRFLDLVSDQNMIARINCGGHGGSGSANVDITGDLIVNAKIKCAFYLVKNLVDKTGGMGEVLAFVNSYSTVIVSDDYKKGVAITEKLIPGSGTGNEPIRIRVNGDLLKDAPQELTVAIMLHEFLHAYLQKAEPEGVSDHYTILNNYSLLVAEELKKMFPDISPEDTWGLILAGLEVDIDVWKDPEYKAAFDEIASYHGISREKAKEIFNKFLANGAGTSCK